MRSDKARISSSSAETSSTATPSSRCLMIELWMNSIEPTSMPRVGCDGDQQLDRAAELARHDHFLLVAARKRAGRRPASTGGAHIELFDQVAARAVDRLGVDRACHAQRARGNRWTAPGCRRSGRSAPGRGGGGLRGCGPRPASSDPARCGSRSVSLPSDATSAAGDSAQPGDRLDQLGLAVALHAGDAQRFRRRAPAAKRRPPPAGRDHP